MTTTDQIRFIIFHTEAGSRTTDLDAIVNHAGNLVSDVKLLSILMDFKKRLKRDGYNFTLWKEGDDDD